MLSKAPKSPLRKGRVEEPELKALRVRAPTHRHFVPARTISPSKNLLISGGKSHTAQSAFAVTSCGRVVDFSHQALASLPPCALSQESAEAPHFRGTMESLEGQFDTQLRELVLVRPHQTGCTTHREAFLGCFLGRFDCFPGRKSPENLRNCILGCLRQRPRASVCPPTRERTRLFLCRR